MGGVAGDDAVVVLDENIPLVPLLAPPNADWVLACSLCSAVEVPKLKTGMNRECCGGFV